LASQAFNQSYVPIIGSSFLHDMILSWKLSAQTAMEFALSISAQVRTAFIFGSHSCYRVS
jgi:hypothetical protein